jgi:hypothetical protein
MATVHDIGCRKMHAVATVVLTDDCDDRIHGSRFNAHSHGLASGSRAPRLDCFGRYRYEVDNQLTLASWHWV